MKKYVWLKTVIEEKELNDIAYIELLFDNKTRRAAPVLDRKLEEG